MMTLSPLMRFLKEHWLIFLALVILTVALITLIYVVPSPSAGQGFAKESLVAEVMGALILFFTLLSVYIQVSHIRGQNELQRNVASKSAIQELNKVLLDEQQDDFLDFLFPKPGPHPPRKIMMAFSLMNSLEMLYLTKDEKVSDEDFTDMLKGFVGNVRAIWEADEHFATVYHPDFQKIVKGAFAKMDQEAKHSR